MTESRYLGIDISKARIDVVLKTEAGEKGSIFNNDPSGWKRCSIGSVARMRVMFTLA